MPSSSTADRRKAVHAAEEEMEKQGRPCSKGGETHERETITNIAAMNEVDEYVSPAVDRQLLQQAYQTRRARVEELSQFRSRRGKQRRDASRNGGKLYQPPLKPPTAKTVPTTLLLLLRIKFPDGAILTARFYEGEHVADVFTLLRTTLSLAPLPPQFVLLNLGGMGPRRLSAGEGKSTIMNMTLKACGLTAPAATLLLQWQRESRAAVPKDTIEWIDPALLHASGRDK
ncbi:ubx domain-containing protein 6 [Nannochloropsis oceanica]